MQAIYRKAGVNPETGRFALMGTCRGKKGQDALKKIEKAINQLNPIQ